MRVLCVLALLASAAVFGSAADTNTAPDVTYNARTQAPLGQFPYPANHPFLTTATDNNFRQLLVENTMPVLVNFYKKGDKLSQTVAKGFEQTALALRPLVDVVVMDGELEGAKNLLSTYGIENLPVILHFNSDLHPIPQAPGQWAKLPDGYQGDATPGSLARWSLGKLSNAIIERVTDDHSLSQFLGVHDHLAYPKVLLVTNDTNAMTPPLFMTMAQRMRKAAVFGVAHNCETVNTRYGVTEFPAVLGFIPEGSSFGDFTLTRMPPFPSEGMIAAETARLEALKTGGADKGGAADEDSEEAKERKREAERKERRNERLRKRGMEATEETGSNTPAGDMNTPNLLYGDVEYEQALADFKHFEEWVDTIGIPFEKRHEYGMLIATEEEKSRGKAAEMAKWANALDPRVLKTKADWTSNCLKLKNKGVCVVVFRDVEDFADNAQAKKRLNIDLFQNISRKAAMKSQTPLQICLADGTTNHKLINALGITNGVPDMVAIWPAKGKYYNFLGAINERNVLNLFLDKVLKNKGGKKLPSDLPTFLKTGQSEEDLAAEESASSVWQAERPSGDDDEISDEL